MAAPGVQLNSDKQLEYFEPTVDQYVKKLEQAVASNDLSAARQALANLDRAVTTNPRSNSNETGVQDSQRTGTAMDDIGKALENGDLTSAESAVGELRKSLSSARGGPLDSNGNASQSSFPGSEDVGDSPETREGTSGKLDLKA